MSRIPQLQSLLQQLGVDALWVTFLPDIRWACGFSGSNGLLIVRSEGAHFVSDGRYRTQAEQEVVGARVHTPGYDLAGYVAEESLLKNSRNVVYQSDHLTVAARNELRDRFPLVRWTGEEELLVRHVATKEDEEVDAITRAQRITEEVFEHVTGWLREGQSERDVAAEIVHQHLLRGADSTSFDPIVASGSNAALPHARPTDRVLQAGDAVVLDFGCVVDGYASDMTRMVYLGDPAEEFREVYDLVLAAQQEAIKAARAGMLSKDLDEVARSVIREGGYEEYFAHGLGHGIGLQVHEWPRVSYTVDYDLPRNCAVTIEPGVYLPGRFGVRIEDVIVIRDDGSDVITAASNDLVVL